MKLKNILYILLNKLGLASPLFYINGPETLPPPLSTEEENMLINQESQTAKDRLIVHNLRLVVYIARKFDTTGINLEDLISIGTIGLIKGVNTFHPDRNIKLATYASRCIENEILITPKAPSPEAVATAAIVLSDIFSLPESFKFL